MRFIEDLCPPALLYLIFLVINLGFDMALGLWITFAVKVIFGIAAIVVLDMFCGIGLSVVSWFIVAAPFVITALGTAIAMGSNIDELILIQLGQVEKFMDKKARPNDLPAPSNTIDK